MTSRSGVPLIERLVMDLRVEPGTDALVKRPHVWVNTGTDPRWPGVVIRQAQSIEGGWLAQVSWVEVDPQRPEDAVHRVSWLPADQVSCA